jgi:hypothetical protein
MLLVFILLLTLLACKAWYKRVSAIFYKPIMVDFKDKKNTSTKVLKYKKRVLSLRSRKAVLKVVVDIQWGFE